jgi:hypothetical protein
MLKLLLFLGVFASLQSAQPNRAVLLSVYTHAATREPMKEFLLNGTLESVTENNSHFNISFDLMLSTSTVQEELHFCTTLHATSAEHDKFFGFVSI